MERLSEWMRPMRGLGRTLRDDRRRRRRDESCENPFWQKCCGDFWWWWSERVTLCWRKVFADFLYAPLPRLSRDFSHLQQRTRQNGIIVHFSSVTWPRNFHHCITASTPVSQQNKISFSFTHNFSQSIFVLVLRISFSFIEHLRGARRGTGGSSSARKEKQEKEKKTFSSFASSTWISLLRDFPFGALANFTAENFPRSLTKIEFALLSLSFGGKLTANRRKFHNFLLRFTFFLLLF